MLASGSLPDVILLEDANDLCEFMEFGGRTPPREQWCLEIAAEILNESCESLF